jgi:CheY-like chemotaxis protein
MEDIKFHLLLADDDLDDCEFFEEALMDMPFYIKFTKVGNGAELMGFLSTKEGKQSDIIFIDLNMPRKSGMECVVEIKSSDKLSDIPLVIFSTSLESTVVSDLFEIGASYYIQKPTEFANLKRVIKKAIMLISNNELKARSMEQFIIQP